MFPLYRISYRGSSCNTLLYPFLKGLLRRNLLMKVQYWISYRKNSLLPIPNGNLRSTVSNRLLLESSLPNPFTSLFRASKCLRRCSSNIIITKDHRTIFPYTCSPYTFKSFAMNLTDKCFKTVSWCGTILYNIIYWQSPYISGFQFRRTSKSRLINGKIHALAHVQGAQPKLDSRGWVCSCPCARPKRS